MSANPPFFVAEFDQEKARVRDLLEQYRVDLHDENMRRLGLVFTELMAPLNPAVGLGELASYEAVVAATCAWHTLLAETWREVSE